MKELTLLIELQSWLGAQLLCGELALFILLPLDEQLQIRSRICCICSMVVSPAEPQYFWTRRVMVSTPTIPEQNPSCQPMRMTMMVSNWEAIYKKRKEKLYNQIATNLANKAYNYNHILNAWQRTGGFKIFTKWGIFNKAVLLNRSPDMLSWWWGWWQDPHAYVTELSTSIRGKSTFVIFVKIYVKFKRQSVMLTEWIHIYMQVLQIPLPVQPILNDSSWDIIKHLCPVLHVHCTAE